MEANNHQQKQSDEEACDRPSPLFNTENARKWFDRWFKSNEENTLQLCKEAYISDLRRCVDMHIKYLENNQDKPIFRVYNERLKAIRIKLES